ncbi:MULTISPECIES: hypothetical protein [unclassified Halomonas]|uniref:Blue (type 1) copper domain-containing protein n=1 Tax=Halomonas sp. RT37 TaxID=2950872 RepID=A0AAU7KLP5_9GAMM|nr:hypothetical protein [Halomonas sp.]MCJ8286590.1 hypothetical protein [Halomonas sp.]
MQADGEKGQTVGWASWALAFGLVGALGWVAPAHSQQAQAADTSSGQATVIELTQVGCQFLESENGTDHGIHPQSKADCEAFNDDTGEARLAEARVLKVPTGDYVFRVKNEGVPYDLGFWLRGDGLLNRARLPSVSGGGLGTGQTGDFAVSLEPGEYVYSCPLNPTLDYKLVVEGQG